MSALRNPIRCVLFDRYDLPESARTRSACAPRV